LETKKWFPFNILKKSVPLKIACTLLAPSSNTRYYNPAADIGRVSKGAITSKKKNDDEYPLSC